MPRRKLSDEEKHARKIDRELAVTVRQMAPEYQERERDIHRKQQARWARENPDCINDAQRKWKAKQDPALFKEYAAKAYALNGEKIKARTRAYYERNKKRINAARRAARAKLREMRKPSKKIGPAIVPAHRV